MNNRTSSPFTDGADGTSCVLPMKTNATQKLNRRKVLPKLSFLFTLLKNIQLHTYKMCGSGFFVMFGTFAAVVCVVYPISTCSNKVPYL